jgi:hypothetical protein
MQAVAVKPSLFERINLRIAMFALFALLVIGYPVYVYLDGVISGGVKDLGNGVTFVDLKFMSSFVFDQNNGTIEDVPQQWRDLNGKKVVLEGEVWAPYSASDYLQSFQLCYSVAKCCFSGPPQVQHFVNANVKDGGAVPNLQGVGKVRVVGILKVDVKRDDTANKVSSVFEMELENISLAD